MCLQLYNYSCLLYFYVAIVFRRYSFIIFFAAHLPHNYIGIGRDVRICADSTSEILYSGDCICDIFAVRNAGFGDFGREWRKWATDGASGVRCTGQVLGRRSNPLSGRPGRPGHLDGW